MNASDLREPELTADQFAIAQRELGLSDRELANNLGLSPQNGDVTVRKIKNDKIPCSGPIACAMVAFLQGFRPAWYRGGEDERERAYT